MMDKIEVRLAALELYFQLVASVNDATGKDHGAWIPSAEGTVRHLDVITDWLVNGDIPEVKDTDEREQA